MKEIKRKKSMGRNENADAKLGGLVCNKSAPSIKSAKLGGLVCNKSAPSVRGK